jgi:hypothetical protein
VFREKSEVVRVEPEGAYYIFFSVSFLEDFNATRCLRLLGRPMTAGDPQAARSFVGSGFVFRATPFFSISISFFDKLQYILY